MKVKIVHLLLISNVLAAVIGGITFGVIANSSAIMFSMCAVGVIVATAGLSIFIARQISVGLQTLEKSVATAHGGDPLSIHELESTRIKIQQYVQRWSVAAKRSRTQNKVIDWMVETLESRPDCQLASETTDSGTKLRLMLTAIGQNADGCLMQLVDAIEYIQKSVAQISDIISSQSDEVEKSTSHVEHLCQSMAAVSSAASKAQESGSIVSGSLGIMSNEMLEHIAAIRRIHAGVESSESRLRAMLDHVREIGAIANSIRDVSSRTDMLALNMSIESARSAGSISGSSNVAEEVRRLAEQASQASQEVTSLVESIQLETQESIATIAQQCGDLSSEMERIDSTADRLTDMSRNASSASTHLKAIGKASNGQIRLSTELVSFVEGITTIVKESREHTDSVVLHSSSLADAAAQFDNVLDAIRSISTSDGDLRNEAGPAASPTLVSSLMS